MARSKSQSHFTYASHIMRINISSVCSYPEDNFIRSLYGSDKLTLKLEIFYLIWFLGRNQLRAMQQQWVCLRVSSGSCLLVGTEDSLSLCSWFLEPVPISRPHRVHINIWNMNPVTTGSLRQLGCETFEKCQKNWKHFQI